MSVIVDRETPSRHHDESNKTTHFLLSTSKLGRGALHDAYEQVQLFYDSNDCVQEFDDEFFCEGMRHCNTDEEEEERGCECECECSSEGYGSDTSSSDDDAVLPRYQGDICL